MSSSISSLKKQLLKKPDNVSLLGTLAESYRKKGLLPLAIKTYLQLTKLEPENYQALNNLGALQRSVNDVDASYRTLTRADELLPNNPIILTNLANTFLKMGRYDYAVNCAKKAVDIQPDFFDSNEMLAEAYISSGNYSQAISWYEKALSIQPKTKQTIIAIARAHHLLGENDKAYKILSPVLKPPTPECATVYFNISKKIGKQKEAVDYLHKVLKTKAGTSSDVLAALHFCLGKYYNDTGLYEKAINSYHVANKSCNRHFDITKLRHQFNDIINTFPDAAITPDKISSNHTKKPIFIVGMPRSGTSLVEQIIASHPDVFGAGELNNIDIMVNETRFIHNEKFPMSIANLNTKDLDTLANKYLTHINNLSDEEEYVTDKMPHNFMHINFILRLFPSARIIHCARHPLDTVLSCYFSDFGNMGHDYAYNLSDLGKKYLEYQRLMKHWKGIYKDKIYTVRYEKLVTNTEAETRTLIDFCHLEWDESCLKHHQSKRKTHTLSYDQVNKPIYTASMFRWKHYEPYIKKLIDTLKTVSEEHEALLSKESLEK